MSGLLPPGMRCTGYWYARAEGMDTDLEFLRELGLAAWRVARWSGCAPALVPEGPYRVHTWPEEVWDAAVAELAAGYGMPEGEQAAISVSGGIDAAWAALDRLKRQALGPAWGRPYETRDAGWPPQGS